jgi:predicted enzyme related to lactoylglutathione lyase
MINVTEIAYTGYPVTDVARARKFYESVLGLTANMAHEIQPGLWWIEYEIGGASLAISNAWTPSGQSGPTVALEVADLDAALATLKQLGVPVTYGPMDSPVCRFFGVSDLDGNGITIHQRKAGCGDATKP